MQKYQANKPIQGQKIKSAQERLADLDALLKRNTGQGIHIGADATSNTPMYIPGKVVNPSGLTETASTQSSLQRPTPVQRDIPVEEPQQDPQQEQPTTIEDFLSAFNEAYNAPENQQNFGDPQLEGIMSTADGGMMLGDGTIVYEDGTYRMGDPSATAIRSNVDGSIGYSDGSSRMVAPDAIRSVAGDRERIGYSDGSTRFGNYQYGEGQPVNTPGGLQGLISGIFGQDRTITQDYGNINPIEPTAGNVNLGTDIRTRDLTGDQRGYKLKVPAEVVQVFKDDGTRFGDISGHKGYGNSVLVRLNSGEMLRFSHLGQIGDYQPGQTIKAGEVFGTPGATGNTTGEHLDLEYYNAQGQISNPSQFSGFSDPQGLRTPLPGQAAPGTLDRGQEQPQMSQAQSQPKQAEVSYPGQTVNEGIVQPAAQAIGTAITARNPNSVARTAVGEKVNTLGNLLAQKGVGSSVGNSPEGFVGAGEAVKGDLPAAGRELSATIERVNPTPRIDTGISEALRGDFAGAKKNFLDTTNRVAGRLNALPGQIANEIVKPAYADDGSIRPSTQSLQDNVNGAVNDIKQYGGDKLAQAGEGIKSLGQAGLASLEGVFKPKQSVPSRVVGDVKGTADNALAGTSSLMDNTASLQSMGKNDIRDPFFKSGQVNDFASFLNPGAVDNSGGALSLDLFNDKFFQDQKNIGTVFGNTSLKAGAEKKYNDYQEQVRKLEEEKQRNRPTLQDYLNQGKTVAQYYAETGQQSSLDSLGKQGYDVRTNNNPEGATSFSGGNPQFAPTDSGEVAQQGQQTGQGVQSYTYDNGRTVKATPGTNLRVDSSGNVQRVDNASATLPNGKVTNFSTPVSQPSAQLNKPSSGGSLLNKPNVFSTIAKKIFRK